MFNTISMNLLKSNYYQITYGKIFIQCARIQIGKEMVDSNFLKNSIVTYPPVTHLSAFSLVAWITCIYILGDNFLGELTGFAEPGHYNNFI
jgi:hypothetical protein